MSDFEYAGVRRIVYEGGLTFVPVCQKCGRFVKADPTIEMNGIDGWRSQPNAECRKCGRVEMPCEGYVNAAEFAAAGGTG